MYIFCRNEWFGCGADSCKSHHHLCDCVSQTKKLLINTENVAYGMGLELKDNVAYTSTATGDVTKDDEGNYGDVSRDEVTATSSDLSMSANQAYGLMQS